MNSPRPFRAPHRARHQGTVPAAASFALILALTGCADPAKPVAITPSASASVTTPTPSPSKIAADDADTLFTISAKVRSVGGRTVSVALIGHQPITSTSPAAATLLSTFLAGCVAQNGRSVSDATVAVSAAALATYGSSLMRLDVTTDPAGQRLFAPVTLELGSAYAPAIVSGSGITQVSSTETCTNRYQMATSGVGRAVVNYESGTEAPDPGKWAFGHYGFSVAADSGASIESCSITITDRARPTVAAVAGWQPGTGDTGINCGIGYIGE